MCEYMIINTETKIPECKDNGLCTFCVLGNAKKYKEIKEKEISKYEINK